MKKSIFAAVLFCITTTMTLAAQAFTILEATMIKDGMMLAATPYQPAKLAPNLILRISGAKPGDGVYMGDVISHTARTGPLGKIAADGTFNFNLANFNAAMAAAGTPWNAEFFPNPYCTLSVTVQYASVVTRTANLAGCGSTTAPAPVQGALPKVTSISLTSFSVSWTSSTATSANLVWMLDSTSSNPITSVRMSKSGTTFTATVSGLTQETWYRIGVKAVDSSGRQVGYGDLANGIGVLVRTSAPKPPCYCTRPR